MARSVYNARVRSAATEIALEMLRDPQSSAVDRSHAERALLGAEPDVDKLTEHELVTLESLLSKASGEATEIELRVVGVEPRYTSGSSCDRGPTSIEHKLPSSTPTCSRCSRYSHHDLAELAAALAVDG